MFENCKNITGTTAIAVKGNGLPINMYELQDLSAEEWNMKAQEHVKKLHTINSRDVAVMVEKNHKELLRDIRTYIEYMESPILGNENADLHSDGESNFGFRGQRKIAPSDFFLESSYLSSQNKTLLCYEITKMGCEMIANKMTGKKGILFTATYVKRFNDMEVEKQQQLITTTPAPALSDRLDRLIALLEQQMQIPAVDAPLLPEPIPEAEKSYMAQLREKKMLTKAEAAFYIGVCVKTLNSIIEKQDFYPLARIGFGRGRVFINREKLDQWIDEQDGSMKDLK